MSPVNTRNFIKFDCQRGMDGPFTRIQETLSYTNTLTTMGSFYLMKIRCQSPYRGWNWVMIVVIEMGVKLDVMMSVPISIRGIRESEK